jgi:sec-independent protein translocase protein TatC
VLLLEPAVSSAEPYFGHLAGFPAMWGVLSPVTTHSSGVKFLPALDDTFAFYVKAILGLGLTFQMPMLVYFLARFGMVSGRFLVKQFRYAVLIIVIVAAVVTPSGDLDHADGVLCADAGALCDQHRCGVDFRQA